MQRRAGLKLWRPGQGPEGEGKASPEPQQQPGGGEDEPDELDALMDQYTSEAKADTMRVLKAAGVKKGPKSMAEARKEGLDKPLAADNKGFKLLTKMGYQPGRGIGRDGTGRAEPIPVDIKAAKTGLGVDEAKKRKQAEDEQRAIEEAVKRAKLMQQHQAQYQQARRGSFVDRKLLGQLHAAWKANETLDSNKGTDTGNMLLPQLPTIRHALKLAKAQAAGGGDGGGSLFNSKVRTGRKQTLDLGGTDDEVPTLGGDTAESHSSEYQESENDDDSDNDEQHADMQEQLCVLLKHLRSAHFYCFYCGCTYGDEQDMAANCPGLLEDDH